MSYATEAAKLGKRAVYVVELYLDTCANIYGSAPCTAAIGVTGNRKCFNTFGTCQDAANYAKDPAPRVWRFATERCRGLWQPGEPPVFPTLVSVDFAPTVLTPGKGLGIRSSVSISISDHPWTDVGCDPYLADRGGNPDNVGTFWGKFLARQKHYENRRCDVLVGFLDDDGAFNAANFERSTYVLTRIAGPDSNGAVRIEAKDPLKFADGEKAKFPPASQSTLLVAVNNTATSWQVTDPNGALYVALKRYGPPNPTVPGPQCWVRCEDEIVKVTAIPSGLANPLTLTVQRATMPAWYEQTFNVAADHDAGKTVQGCWVFDDESVEDISYFLLNEAAGIPSSYLPLAEWQANIADGFSYLRFHRLLTEPVAVKDLLAEITEHSVLIWWDERGQKVRLKGLRFSPPLPATIDDDTAIIADSATVSDDPQSLSTQVWVYFGHQWPLADPKQLRSYRIVDVRVDQDAEAPEAYGKSQIFPIYSRWLSPAQSSVAVEVGHTLLRQYSTVRKAIAFAMDPKDDAVRVGDLVGISTKLVQDDVGNPSTRNYLVTQAESKWTGVGFRLEYVAVEQFSFTRAGMIGPNTLPDYSAASPAQRQRYAFISANAAPYFPDGSTAYQII